MVRNTKMQNQYNGVVEAYDEVCQQAENKSFYEWVDDPSILYPGQICYAPVWYEKSNKWILFEDNYDPVNEENSTWKVVKFKIDNFLKPTSYVMKYFQLEKTENLITTIGKIRPVILLKKTISDWLNPDTYSEDHWLCLPLFEYKTRHNQNYVINDQRFKIPDRLYIPPRYNAKPGIPLESAARFQALQMINQEYLKPLKAFCKEKNMQYPFKIIDYALKIIMYHFFKNLNLFVELNEEGTVYALFVECVNDYIDAALKDSLHDMK